MIHRVVSSIGQAADRTQFTPVGHPAQLVVGKINRLILAVELAGEFTQWIVCVLPIAFIRITQDDLVPGEIIRRCGHSTIHTG